MKHEIPQSPHVIICWHWNKVSFIEESSDVSLSKCVASHLLPNHFYISYIQSKHKLLFLCVVWIFLFGSQAILGSWCKGLFVESQTGHNRLALIRMQLQRSRSAIHRQTKNRSTKTQDVYVENLEREKPREPTTPNCYTMYEKVQGDSQATTSSSSSSNKWLQ